MAEVCSLECIVAAVWFCLLAVALTELFQTPSSYGYGTGLLSSVLLQEVVCTVQCEGMYLNFPRELVVLAARYWRVGYFVSVNDRVTSDPDLLGQSTFI